MTKEYRVNVFKDCNKEEIVGRVRYNSNLDFWNGRQWGNGGVGNHLGLTKLKNGEFVLIHGTDWIDETDWAVIVSKEIALKEVLKSGNEVLLNTKRFRELKELYERLEEETEDLEEE